VFHVERGECRGRARRPRRESKLAQQQPEHEHAAEVKELDDCNVGGKAQSGCAAHQVVPEVAERAVVAGVLGGLDGVEGEAQAAVHDEKGSSEHEGAVRRA